MSMRQAFAAEPTGRLDNAFFEKRYVKLRALSKTWGRLDSCTHSVVCGPFGSNLLNSNYVDAGVPMIRPFNLRGLRADAGEIVYLDEAFVSETGLKVFPKYTLMFARVGDINVGVSLFERATISPNVIAAQVDHHKINPLFLNVFANTSYGLMQLEAATKAVAQPTISTETVRALRIPAFSATLQKEVATSFSRAEALNNRAVELLTQAEQTLLTELGLADWTPPEPLTYLRTSRDVLATGRFDSQFHAPRVQDLIKRLSRSRSTIGDVAPLRKEYFAPQSGQPFDYIEIGDVSPYGETGGSRLDGSEAPSRATWIVHDGDVITSTVRPNRRLSAMIQPGQKGFVCSSGFAVLNPQRVPPEVMLTYLRLPLVCELMDLHTTATMYPAIAVADLLALPFAPPSAAASSLIVEQVQSAKRARDQAAQLLDGAKRAVEIAIENTEAAALRYLEGS